MLKFLIAILLEEPLSTKIKKIQEQHKSADWNISMDPHITLVPPSVAAASEQQAIEVLKDLASGIAPFEIEISGVGRFYNKANTVFAEIAHSTQLQNLHDKLVRASDRLMRLDMDDILSREFKPHITLSNKLESDGAYKILDQVKRLNLKSPIRISGFSLFKKYPEEARWQEIQNFLLQS